MAHSTGECEISVWKPSVLIDEPHIKKKSGTHFTLCVYLGLAIKLECTEAPLWWQLQEQVTLQVVNCEVSWNMDDIKWLIVDIRTWLFAVSSYTEIEVGFPGRSAAMVVITVILSVAAFILLIGISISTLVSPSDE